MSNRDSKYTLALAKAALERIEALSLPADPSSFAVWYAYVAAANPQINQTINDLLAGKTKLSMTDIDRICDAHLSPQGNLARIDKVSSDIAQEIDQIVDLIASAAGNAATYQNNLTDASLRLNQPSDRDAIRVIVQTLVQSTKAMESRNQSLETALRVSKNVIENLQHEMDEIRRETLRDPLTSLANRKHFEQALQEAISDAIKDRSHDPFSVLLIDIDHFKQFNDTHGHQIGDDVLRLLARALKDSVKGRDLAARYGGEEFAVLLPSTDLGRAKTVAENIREAVAGKALLKRSTGQTLGKITVSIGAAEYQAGDDLDTLIDRSDKALYSAKNAGRNIVYG
jgi:diguanylate cyclase